MSVCPNCHQPIEADFGMVTCTSCEAVVFVEMSGEIKIYEDSLNKNPSDVVPPLQEEIPPTLVDEDKRLDSEQNEAPSLVENFSDVVEFANSDLSQVQDGAYAYSVLVTGIDTKEIRKEIHDTLMDERLGVSSELESIHEGVLEIRNLNPVKASVIVNRLRGMNVKIQWVQYAITEMDISRDSDS